MDATALHDEQQTGAPAPAAPSRAPAESGRILSTLNEDGTRRWMCPKPSPGRFLKWRRVVAFALIAIFTVLPFIKVGGRPLVLLDLSTRHFTILGKTFLPTDTVLLAVLLVSVFVAVFFVTAVFGRVWCGWGCPQTVYMEFVYRPLERFFTGTPGRKKTALQASGAGTALKYAVYLLISMGLAHTFLAYFVGVDRLWMWMQRSPLEHPAAFILVAAVTAAMMFDFAYFREQTCIVACPYGRLQSAMLDRHSRIVAYNPRRGEPRGKAQRRGSAPAPTAGPIALPVLGSAFAEPPARAVGDCVDCRLCVTTCPTGIDIRDGLQMECINCAQCIDACDAVMDKLGRERGLIGYSSQAALEGKASKLLRPRVVVYALLLCVLASVFTALLLSKPGADVSVLRGLGRPFTALESGDIANPLRLKIVNRTDRAAEFTLGVSGHEGARISLADQGPVRLGPGESRSLHAMVSVPPGAFERGSAWVKVIVESDAGFAKEVPVRLMGPGSAHSGREAAEEDEER